MSGLYDFKVAETLQNVPVDALIMAAALRADSGNLARLQVAFPQLVAEAGARHRAPGGRLDSD